MLEALLRIVPSPLQEEPDIQGWGWLNRLWQEGDEATTDEVPILDAAAREVTEDLELFRQMEEEAARERDYRRSQNFQRVAYTVRSRDFLGFLGSSTCCPSMVSEYAPGGELVAAKRVWVSGGIYKRPERDWPTYHYAVCPE